MTCGVSDDKRRSGFHRNLKRKRRSTVVASDRIARSVLSLLWGASFIMLVGCQLIPAMPM